MAMNIPNFAVVDHPTADAPGVYRGAQPVSREDWQGLKDLGVTQIIKLNTDEEGSDDEALALGMKVMKCPITLTQQLLTEPDLTNLACAVSFVEAGTFIHCGSTARTQHALLIGEAKGAGG